MRSNNAEPTGFRDAMPDAEAPRAPAITGTLSVLSPARKLLHSPEEEIQAILDNRKDGIVLVDADHRILTINRGTAEASQYSEPEVRGTPLDTLVSPQNFPHISSLINTSFSGLTTEFPESGTCAGSDEKPPLEVDASPSRKNDQIVRAAITTRSADDHITRTEAKQLNEDRFRNLIENTSDWVWEVNTKCVYTYVSPRVREILGYEPQEVLGKTIFDLMSLREASQVTKRFASAIAAQQALKLVQITCLHKEGRPVVLETSAVPVFDGTGKVCGYHGIHRDITGRENTEQRVAQDMGKLERTLEGIIEAMTLAVEARDQYAVGHQQRVAQLALAMVWEMGRSPELGHTVHIGGLLHDLGKVFIPIEMLTKPGQLTQAEFSAVKNHPRAAYGILRSIQFPWPVADVVLQHHERMDGSGYPSGLKGDEIRLEARILGVADTVEAMFHPRSYRPALGMDKALREIAKDKGVLYDRDVVEICLSVFLDRGFKFKSG